MWRRAEQRKGREKASSSTTGPYLFELCVPLPEAVALAGDDGENRRVRGRCERYWFGLCRWVSLAASKNQPQIRVLGWAGAQPTFEETLLSSSPRPARTSSSAGSAGVASPFPCCSILSKSDSSLSLRRRCFSSSCVVDARSS